MRFALPVLALVLVALVSPAFAAIDISSALTSISTDGTDAITDIGQALIALAAIGLVFRWVKGALF